MLLPQEIRKKEFSLAMGGYARSEVNSYLEYIADNYEKLRRENDELSRRLDAAIEKLDQYNAAELAAITENAKAGDNAINGAISAAVSSLRFDLDMVSAKLREIELLVSDDAVTEKSETVEEIAEPEETEETETDELVELDAIEDETDDVESIDGAESDVASADDGMIFDISTMSEAESANEPEEAEEPEEIEQPEEIEETEMIEEVVEAENAEADVIFDVPTEEAVEEAQTLPEQLDMDDFLADFFNVDSDDDADASGFDFVEPVIEEPTTAEKQPSDEPIKQIEQPTEQPEEKTTEQPKKASKVRFHLAKKNKKSAPAPQKDADNLDDILNALKLQYDSVSESAEPDDDDFDMTNLDEFNYIFGNSSSKIDTVRKNNDFDDDLYDD